ncbi:MAG: 50S ribosomal protein L18 [Candidatus Lloydbacteria bacterium RIFCSPHIGHO2_02_FULL_54_17]|uniref:Large ribosomal subunit protein uL18 n=1 Tax=Candidatus Lloydbacteria bacterium RIFCSPHIGHO2_02_FULL_54_17 TaxID=1798664 RepID=A0A1G2DGT0_9BACT|nr:MAG: 50S ribosomal protein L18 [Candidatus Lloydbacteria bacterium RIFCSPHIGHO2_01_FULL_54_11]OGZ12171.1 MAG: 50S ribosomal protein L18 [Candidatus Lloydbacteria bacterium RIFCSPHIGHO2_02_FULL_54_17]OGZ12962.1 MAG: 50S ribosomal protein L18 [Candidatus Lloydbacteria bacterium RIFCSPLOWO2_01_FULL_54_18]OGZ15959.1 MAG: 50S ribosomal protein L18 [Candidatus Lloydbacteria bacterium RIFCSPLOWO2_02_FULL_54_12]
MNKIQKKNYHRMRRHNRIRAKVSGTKEIPRLAVFRSARHLNVQLIDDVAGKTLASASDIKMTKGTKMERATEVGKAIALKAKEAKITKAVFDRGGFLYAGRVRAVADAARKGGIVF